MFYSPETKPTFQVDTNVTRDGLLVVNHVLGQRLVEVSRLSRSVVLTSSQARPKDATGEKFYTVESLDQGYRINVDRPYAIRFLSSILREDHSDDHLDVLIGFKIAELYQRGLGDCLNLDKFGTIRPNQLFAHFKDWGNGKLFLIQNGSQIIKPNFDPPIYKPNQVTTETSDLSGL